MKKSELVNILKEYLNDEVRGIIKEEIEHFFSSVFDQSVTEQKQTQKPIVRPQLRKKAKPKLQFKNTSILNQMLNETVENYEPLDEGKVPGLDYNPVEVEEEIPQLTFNTKTVTGGNPKLRSKILQKMGLDSGAQTGAPISAEEMIPEDRKHVAIPEEVEKALMRDYTALVKSPAFNKNKK